MNNNYGSPYNSSSPSNPTPITKWEFMLYVGIVVLIAILGLLLLAFQLLTVFLFSTGIAVASIINEFQNLSSKSTWLISIIVSFSIFMNIFFYYKYDFRFNKINKEFGKKIMSLFITICGVSSIIIFLFYLNGDNSINHSIEKMYSNLWEGFFNIFQSNSN